MTLLKDNNFKDINVALLSLEADIKNKIAGFDTSVIDKQLAEINSRIDKINAGGNNTSDEIEDINSKLNRNSNKIKNLEQNIGDIDTQINGIEQKLSDIFSAENKVTDFNTTTNSGIYYWVTDAANRPTDYGVLLVNKHDGGSSTSIWINQIAYGTNNKIYFRQNINSTGWKEWKAVAFEGELIATLTVNGKTYNGSEAVDAGVQTVANGGTGVTTQADINKAFIGNLETGESDVTDGTEFVSSYASDKGFAETAEGALNKPYKRQFVKVWNYIKGKISSVLGLTKDNYGGKASTAGTADTVDNYHASQLWRSDGATWNPNANVVMTPSGNGSEWSFDFRNKNGATGTYWQVWDENKYTLLRVNADDGKVSAPYGFVGNLSGKADTAGTADNANRLKAFASWNNQYDYDATNGVRVYVYKITMASYFNSILVQIYDDINYARSRKYFLGLWHVDNYGYSVCVTDLGGTKYNGLRVWFGNDGNVYLQADVYWTSRISFSYLDDVSDVTITKIGSARYGSNADINGNVLFTPLADPIVDCGALRANDSLSSVSREPQLLKTDILSVSSKLEASSKMVIPIGAPSSLEDGCIWIER